MKEIFELIRARVSEVFGVEDFDDFEVVQAPEETGADFASNVAMKLARVCKKNPREIAGELSGAITEFKVEVAGPGFMNFISPDEYFTAKIKDFQVDFEKNISSDELKGKTVICEFSDPNPFKVLHVGHLYTSIVGEAISRLYENAGAKVVRANFGGDVGLHVGKTLYSVLKNGVKLEGEPAEIAEILAKNYVEGTKAYEEDEVAHAEITSLNAEIYRIASENIHEGELAEAYWKGREASYDYFKDFYARIGVKFDKYYPESTVAGRGLSEVSGHVGEVYEMSDGATVFKGEKYGLHTRVFINKAGLPTYEAKDVGLLFTKWDDYHFDKSIVITGNDITEYMKVVLKSVSLYAPELAERTTHLTHGQVKLPGAEKMSSRKGNFLRAVDVLDMVLDEVGDEKIALAATKYAMLKYKVGGDFDFDVKSSVSVAGNSGVYLLYAVVRAKKVLAKIGESGDAGEVENAGEVGDAGNVGAVEFGELNAHERALCRKVAAYPEVLMGAREEMAPHKICTYLYELAQEFSRFYENVKVAGSSEEAARGAMVGAYLKVMEHGLSILGINVPEEM